MVAMTALQRGAGPYTYADLEAMGEPDDGRRYELIDGVLFVSPSPRPLHQIVVGNLHLALHEVTPAPLRALLAPLDVVLTDDTVLEPDLLVTSLDSLGPKNLPQVPVLAVEVLSPSTRRVDLILKKERLQRAGCEHYWVVDPDVPSITCWRLDGGVYAEVASAEGDELAVLTEPFAIELRPADLLL